jgi:ABC-type transport system involved in multi-copper enzyme maturation permease subunit
LPLNDLVAAVRSEAALGGQTLDSTGEIIVAEHVAAPTKLGTGFWNRLDDWLERAGERLNPILVKEARQALKSRQFLVTFSLLLICGWGWSLFGVAMLMPSVYYAPNGPFMLIGYFTILNVPLLLIVPFSAYRSLAGEREDGTYELLSITALSSRQIVTGKLGSAVLQMLVYYSALSPCIAFTYLLRGVDIVTILLMLSYTFFASLLLSAIGLLVATATHFRHVQMLLSVLLLLGLVFVTVMWCSWMGVIIGEGSAIPYDDADFWVGHLAGLMAHTSYMVLFVLTAAAQLSFASDNRSTRLRVVMVVQQLLITGWFLYVWLRVEDNDVLFFPLGLSGIHWMIMGALMTGEWAELSPRVKRRLPQSLLGRAFLTWFNPGSGTGYLFACINLAAATIAILAAAGFASLSGFTGAPNNERLYVFGALIWGYVALYLGVGRLLVLLLRRYLVFGLVLPFLVHVLLALFGAALPVFLQAWIMGFANFDSYTELQASNWFWTLIEAADGNILATPAVPLLVIGGGLGMVLIHLVLVAREVEQVRQEEPERVKRDQQELHPEKHSPEKKPTSPFDD